MEIERRIFLIRVHKVVITIAPKVRQKVASGEARSAAKCRTTGIESVVPGTLKGWQRFTTRRDSGVNGPLSVALPELLFVLDGSRIRELARKK